MRLKGTVSRDFLLLVFFINQFPPGPRVSHSDRFEFFSKIRGDIHSSRLTTDVNDTGGKWKKCSIRKVIIILLGHLWIVELTYIYIFAFKFTLRYLQPIVCHRQHISETGGKICLRCRRYRWQICHRCCWYRWSTLSCKYLRKFSKKFETALMVYSGAWGKLIHEKNQKQKISWHCPFKWKNYRGIVRVVPLGSVYQYFNYFGEC